VPLETPVPRAINDAHAATSDLAVQLIMRGENPFDVRAEFRARRRGR
jgi:hypothetical protein